jgi:DNA-binding winged helix-turn-helix (wHTH) protein/TolB-like protein/Tfp pilus assembly protein PilF
MESREIALKCFGGYRLDPHKRRLLRNGEVLTLMPKAFDLLTYLVLNPGRLVTKDELMSAVWPDTIVEESNLSLNISILRKTLGEKPSENRFIATVPGQGYKFVADVSDASDGTLMGTETKEYEQDPILNEKTNSSGLSKRALVLVLSLIVLIAAGTALWYTLSAESSSERIRSVAVLPFKPLDSNERDETLELGMADTLISKLASSGELTVRPISSVRRFDSIDQDALIAGRQLGVEAVLDGSIQRAGDKVRVTVRMIRTDDGRMIWSAIYDEPATDIFALQDSISRKAAAALRVRLGSGRAPYTSNLEAYQLYMRGRLQVLKATRPELLAGIENFKKAIAVDPAYALAYAGIADAYRTLALGGEMRPLDVLPQSKEAALRAVELDDSLSEAHTVLAASLFWSDWNWASAEEHFKKALDLNPNNADAYSEYAFLLSNLGRHEESLVAAQRSLELDPLNVRANARYGQFLNHAGRTAESVTVLQRTIELDPEYWLAYQFASSVYLVSGEYDQALNAAEASKRLNKESTRPIVYGGYAKAKLGDQVSARADLALLLKTAKERYVPNVNIAVLQLALGERDAALSSLERAESEKDPWMTFLKVEPIWAELQNEQRFQTMKRSMGF